MIVKPVRYDFPDRMRGLRSAEREVAKLERSMAAAHERRDALAFAYLDRRHKRARQALFTVLRREQAEEPDLGSPGPRAQACTDTSGGGSGDR